MEGVWLVESPGIFAIIHRGLNSGRVEGRDNRVWPIIRRGFGFQSGQSIAVTSS